MTITTRLIYPNWHMATLTTQNADSTPHVSIGNATTPYKAILDAIRTYDHDTALAND